MIYVLEPPPSYMLDTWLLRKDGKVVDVSNDPVYLLDEVVRREKRLHTDCIKVKCPLVTRREV